MPQPTREQFEAASRKVAQTAPAGLSQDQFFALVDKELLAGSFQGSPHFTPGVTDDSQHEPDTKVGGWLKSIKEQAGAIAPGLKEMLNSAAHPQSTGDFLNLIVPSAMPMARAKDAGKVLQGTGKAIEGVSEASKGHSITAGVLDGLTRSKPLEGAALAVAPYIGSPIGRAMQKWGGRLNPAKAAIPEVERTIAPLAEAASTAPRSMPALTAPPSMGARMGAKAPTVEESIDDVLRGMLGKTDEATVSTSPARQTGTPGGKTPMGGATSMDMPTEGGYSSGRPDTTADVWKDTQARSPFGNGGVVPEGIPPTEHEVSAAIPDEFDPITVREDQIPPMHDDPSLVTPGEEAAYNSAVSPDPGASKDEAMYQALREQLGGRQGADGAAEVSPPSTALQSSSPVESIDPNDIMPDEWDGLRKFYGSEKLSQLTGLPKEEILKRAPGASHTPLEVQDKMTQDPEGIFKYLPQ